MMVPQSQTRKREARAARKSLDYVAGLEYLERPFPFLRHDFFYASRLPRPAAPSNKSDRFFIFDGRKRIQNSYFGTLALVKIRP
jgi:hypothetical protein